MMYIQEFLQKTDLLNKLAQITGIPLFIVDSNQQVFQSTKLCELIKHKGRCMGNHLSILSEVMSSGQSCVQECDTEYLRVGLPIITNEGTIGVLTGCGLSSKKQEIKQNILLINDIIQNFINKEDMAKEVGVLYEELNLLYEIARTVSNIFDVDEICQMLVEKAVEIIRVERASLMLFDREREFLKIVAAHGIPQEIVKNTRIKVGEGVAGKVVKDGKPLIVSDAEVEKLSEEERLKRYKTKSFISLPIISVPLKAVGEIIGVINLTDKIDRSIFTSRDLKLLTAMATQGAIAIKNFWLFTDAKELFFNTVKSLSSTIDAKDTYTYGHSERVSKIALAIADELNLSFKEKEIIYLAGLLHDVGKIGIPEEILHKPSKLNEKEYSEIKKHPTISAQIIGTIRQMEDVVPIILHHHERFEGRGYPNGLKGKDIPLGSRILAIADTFDAMTSNRPYRDKFTIDYAIAEIKKYSNIQFDPQVTRAFLSAIEKGKILKE
ncbi:MAG: HD domain-containing phosphohydrolase [bacterium]